MKQPPSQQAFKCVDCGYEATNIESIRCPKCSYKGMEAPSQQSIDSLLLNIAKEFTTPFYYPIEIKESKTLTDTKSALQELMLSCVGEEIYHGKQCQLGKRPCGLASQDRLADRCEKISPSVSKIRQAIINKFGGNE